MILRGHSCEGVACRRCFGPRNESLTYKYLEDHPTLKREAVNYFKPRWPILLIGAIGGLLIGAHFFMGIL